jgi:hypothetical protein
VIPRTLRSVLVTAVFGAAFLVLPTSPFATNGAGAAAPLRCTAITVATRHTGFTTETVKVQTTPGALIKATAHYQNLTRVSKSVARRTGAAILSFHNSDPSGHFRVVVDVSVTLGTASAACVTSFADD